MPEPEIPCGNEEGALGLRFRNAGGVTIQNVSKGLLKRVTVIGLLVMLWCWQKKKLSLKCSFVGNF